MWSQNRLEMYTLMTDAGFPPGLEILSEAKCAAAMVLKRKIEAMSREDAETQKSLFEVYS